MSAERPSLEDDDNDNESTTSYATDTLLVDPESSVIDISRHAVPPPSPKFSEKHRLLKLRLTPLREVQRDLERRLGAASQEVASSGGYTATAPFDSSSNYPGPSRSKRRPQEFFINSSNGWKSALDKFRPKTSSTRPTTAGGTRRGKERQDDEITDVIAGCGDDIKALWDDPVVRDVLSRQRSRIEDSPGL